jgi:V/A-type H+-transporting ATPase subunit I
MIVKMKKYAFMVYHKEYDTFLHELRELGVVHVKQTRSIADNSEIQEMLALRKRIQVQLNFFRNLKEEVVVGSIPASKKLNRVENVRLLEKIEGLHEKKQQLQTEKLSVMKDLDYMQIWGDFSYVTIENLKESGYIVSFFNCPTSKFEPSWVEEYNAFLVNNHQSVSYFITVTKSGQDIEIEAERAKMPDMCLDTLNSVNQQLDESIRAVDRRLREMAVSAYNSLEEFDKQIQDEFNYTNVVLQTEHHAEDKIMFLEGWTTKEQAADLEKRFDEKGYFYQNLEITAEDNVPIVLKNNSYARLFEPITKLFSLPNYMEIDPTPLLAPFFMLFFGLCFGDAGYGLLIFIVATLLKFKIKGESRSMLSLAQWLGGTTVIAGGLSGTVFGVALVEIPALQSIKDYFLSQNNLMTLSLVLGILHIIFAKAVAAYKTNKQKGLKYSLAPWGWVFVISTLVIIFGLPVLDIQLPEYVTYICYAIAGISGLTILLYNSPGKNIFINIGSALWGTYNTASGLLGDTLSYIRLFAIGLTGGILGGVYNILGVDMTSGLPIAVRIPVMVIILLIGHGLNIALCTISSLVHPVRLIFVEYFKNSEFEGGGIQYQPFKKT